MTNKETCQAFAAGQEGHGSHLKSVRLQNGAVVLYSYTTPVAYRTGHAGGADALRWPAVFDERSYGPTTGKQVALAKRACGSYETMEHREFRERLRYLGADLSMAR